MSVGKNQKGDVYLGNNSKKKNKKQRFQSPREKYWKDGQFSPRLLALDIMNNHLTVLYKNGSLYWYDKGVYKLGGEVHFKNVALRLLEDEFRKDRIEQAMYWVKHNSDYSMDMHDYDDHLINVANGLLNWKTGELLSHTKERLSTIQLPVTYDPAVYRIMKMQNVAA
ncbi:hypothetical protein CBW65_15870 [Tumebacillus avium]|uniref:Bacteriophage/plasmid primase P4 C-terminal domain-containing protein n=2 Tax=Tumebacillus avium TaxID=1903704 RepID=A0A1Y0ISF6_9BACL|nr:hypothetical protein CBW65_15870 [Tumebacillus avium]